MGMLVLVLVASSVVAVGMTVRWVAGLAVESIPAINIVAVGGSLVLGRYMFGKENPCKAIGTRCNQIIGEQAYDGSNFY